MNQIIEVIIKCYKSSVDLPELVLLIDDILRQQGCEVQAVITKIVEDEDE